MTDHERMNPKTFRLLTTLLEAEEPLYGLDLMKDALIGGAALYSRLDRWKSAGYVVGTWVEGPYPRRRHYALTEQGRAWALDQIGDEGTLVAWMWRAYPWRMRMAKLRRRRAIWWYRLTGRAS